MPTPPSGAAIEGSGRHSACESSPRLLRSASSKQFRRLVGGGIDSHFDPGPGLGLGKRADRPKNWRSTSAGRNWSARPIRAARPLVCGADCDLWSYSRNVDLLWTSRSPLGSSLGLTPYLTWLRQRPQWARGGTPAWTMIQTQPSERLVEQAGTLGRRQRAAIGWQDEQFRLLGLFGLGRRATGHLLPIVDAARARTPPRTAGRCCWR